MFQCTSVRLCRQVTILRGSGAELSKQSSEHYHRDFYVRWRLLLSNQAFKICRIKILDLAKFDASVIFAGKGLSAMPIDIMQTRFAIFSLKFKHKSKTKKIFVSKHCKVHFQQFLTKYCCLFSFKSNLRKSYLC